MPRERLRTLFLTGVAVVVPLAVSAWVLLALVGFVQSLLQPVGFVLRRAGYRSTVTIALLQAASLLVVVVVVVLIGAVVQVRLGQRLVDRVDGFLSSLPALGTVYRTARQMSDLLLDPDDEDGASQFRDVKLVEFPGRETYTLGFLTSESPPQGVVAGARSISGRDEEPFHTLFLPMAPNPFMGGHLTHVPAERVYDVDIEVESAVQYVLTMGVLHGEEEGGYGGEGE